MNDLAFDEEARDEVIIFLNSIKLLRSHNLIVIRLMCKYDLKSVGLSEYAQILFQFASEIRSSQHQAQNSLDVVNSYAF